MHKLFFLVLTVPALYSMDTTWDINSSASFRLTVIGLCKSLKRYASASMDSYTDRAKRDFGNGKKEE